ncbi:mitochondrial potassium channel [Anabrus simplex]|uniref:mitochondrial potassium channel n=1 Tax=Anabrus simplex TaxID=316456 RepID=UPI0034DDC8B8
MAAPVRYLVTGIRGKSYVRKCKQVNDHRYVQTCNYAGVIQSAAEKSDGFVKRKLAELVIWYEQVTGLDEVRLAQRRVLEAEMKFISAQERRREANKKVSDIQNRLKDLYAELDNTTRGEDRYVQLVTQEHRMLKEEKQIVEEFHRYEREEREQFSLLSSSVKESHEKERAQAERTKYWSIIGSVIGTVIGIAGSSINNELKMRELKRLVKESLVHNKSGIATEVPDALSRHEKELSMILSELKSSTSLPADHVIGRLNELLHTLDNKVNIDSGQVSGTREILEAINRQENTIKRNIDELKSILTSLPVVHQIGEKEFVTFTFGVEERLQKEHRQTQYLLIGSTVIAILIPLMSRYLGLM